MRDRLPTFGGTAVKPWADALVRSLGVNLGWLYDSLPSRSILRAWPLHFAVGDGMGGTLSPKLFVPFPLLLRASTVGRAIGGGSGALSVEMQTPGGITTTIATATLAGGAEVPVLMSADVAIPAGSYLWVTFPAGVTGFGVTLLTERE